MYLKKIEIHGFKSFAEQVNIQLDKGITCIVGPNGSGKSNVSDAIKWVLGEQSAKSLRGNKMEDVIFAGTEKRKPRGMAEVTLVLDNFNKKLPIDYNEVAITRRMYRTGESEYYINKNLCRLKDIKAIFMDTGIGVEGYSIIGQGKIDDILNSKIEKKRALFEEAAGIVKYRIQKNGAEKKLENTAQNLTRLDDVIFDLEERIEPLKDESKKVKRYMALKIHLKEVEINLSIYNIDQYKAILENLKKEKEVACRKNEVLKVEYESLEHEMENGKIELELLEERIRKIKEIIHAMETTLGHLNGKKGIQEEKLLSCEKDMFRINGEIQEINQQQLSVKDEIEKLMTTHSGIQSRYEALAEKETYQMFEYEDLSQTIQSKIKLIEENKSKAIELHNQKFGKKNEYGNLEYLIETFMKRKTEIDNELEKIKEEQGLLLDRKKESVESYEQIQLDIENIENNILDNQKKIEAEKKKKVELFEVLNRLNKDKSEADTKHKILSEMETGYEGYAPAVKYIMKRFSNKEATGIYGPIAEIIEVGKTYEIAIEVAIGGALQNIVCDDEMSATKAIKLLKKENIGRATFLPIKAMQSKYSRPLDDKIKEHPGFIGKAINCVEFSEKYRTVMTYLLENIILVDQIDTAVEISKRAKSHFRIITLQGDIISQSGAMTGGSYKKRVTGILTRKNEIKILVKKIQILDGGIAKAEANRSRIDEALNNTQKHINEGHDALKTKELLRLDYQNQLNQINIEERNNGGKKEKLDNELSNILVEQAETDQMKMTISDELEKQEKNIETNEIDLQEIQLNYEKERDELKKINNEMTSFKIELASMVNEKTFLEKDIEKNHIRIEVSTEEKNVKENLLEKFGNERVGFENQIKIYNNKINQMLLDMKDNKKSELDLYEVKKNHLRAYDEKMAGKRKLEEMTLKRQEEKHQLEINLAKNEAKYDSVMEKLWDEYNCNYIQAMQYKIEPFDRVEASKTLKVLKSELSEIGDVNTGSIKEYEIVKEKFEFLTTQKQDLVEAKLALNKVIVEMEKEIKTSFYKTYLEVKEKFEEVFKELFDGGSAQLKLEDPEDLLNTGIELIAQPPGKKLQSISLLSGGEKTLTAIALMFAFLKVKPSPFCILDEIEAALDESNNVRFVKYLKNFAKESQFIIVTHQKTTMESADVLYGVTMAEQGVSKFLSLKLDDEPYSA